MSGTSKVSLRSSLCATVLSLFCISLASAKLAETQEQTIRFETIESSSRGGVVDKQNLIIKDRATWKRLWKMVQRWHTPKVTLPEIDFEREIIIAVFGGESGDAAHRISITQITTDGEHLQVHLKETHGNLACPPPPTTSEAYHIIAIERIKKAEKKIEFLEPEHETITCR